MAEIILNARLREELVKAEQGIETEDFNIIKTSLANGFEILIRSENKDYTYSDIDVLKEIENFGASASIIHHIAFKDSNNEASFERFMSGVLQPIARILCSISDKIDVISIGGKLEEYINFKNVIESRKKYIKGENRHSNNFFTSDGKEVKTIDCRKAFHFLYNMALAKQGRDLQLQIK